MENLFTAEGIQIVAAEALAHLQDALVIKNLCATDVGAEYNVRPNGYQVGDTVRFKINPVFEAKEFDPAVGVVAQPIRSSNRSLTIEKHFDVSVNVGAKEKALEFEGFSQSVLAPGAYALAEEVDKYLAGKIYQAHGAYGSDDLFGTTSGAGGADLALARAEAIKQQLGQNRFCLMNLDLEAALLGQTWFTGAQNRGDDSALTAGKMGHTMGMDFYSSINWVDTAVTHGSGAGVTETDTDLTGTQNMVGTSELIMKEITAEITAGDRLKVAGLKRPLIAAETKAVAISTAALADRTVALVDPITEIIGSEAAVTTVLAGKTVTYKGAIFDSQSLGVAMPMLDAPETGLASVVSDGGVSIRVVADYDSKYKQSKLSMDCLIGGFALDPRRITLLGSHA